MTLSDMLIVQNIDTGDVPYIERDRTVYIRESDLIHLAEMNDFDNIDAIFEYISESHKSPMYNFKLVRDKNIPGVLAESYVPGIDDSILNEFELYDILSENTTMSDEKLWVLISKSLAKFKKGDYEEAPSIEYRLRLCQREIKNVKEEAKDLKKYGAKSIGKIYLVKFIIKSLVRLGVEKIVAASLSTFGIITYKNKIKKIIEWSKFWDGVIDFANYEKMLSRYLYELEKIEEYLKTELDKAKVRDKENLNKKKAVKESSINDKCIADIII